MKKNTYRAVIVGCGRIASLFAQDKKRKGVVTHAQAYLAHPRTKLAAACDRDPERLREFGKRWGVQHLYSDFDEMMRSERPDLVSVCTHNDSHETLVLSALKHGAKGIICEKPLSDSLGSADRMIRACRSRRVPLLVNYSRRYDPMHRSLKKWVKAGGLGKIQGVSCYYTAGIMNTGTHLFDLLRYFFGEVRWVWANSETVISGKGPDVTADLYLQFKQGFGASVTALNVQDYMQFELDIYGTAGRLRIENSGMSARRWKVVEHKVYSGYRTLAPEVRALRTDFRKNLFGLVDSLVDSVEKKEAEACYGTDGMKSLEIGLACYRSLRRREQIELPLRDRNFKKESL